MLVSIVIPTYNRHNILAEAITTVLAQTLKDFELIIVDDGSKPVEHQTWPDERVLVYQRPHRGVSAARNYGAAVAKGKYLAFLDSDDLWRKNKLEKQIIFLQNNPELKICYTDEKWLRNGQHLNQLKKHQKSGGWIFNKCLPLCLISCSSIIMERQVFDQLGGFDEKLPVCEDYDLWLKMAARYPIGYLPEKLIIKRGGHPDQLSRKYWGMDRFRIMSLERLLKGELPSELRQQAISELAKKYDIFLSGAWKRRNYWSWFYYKIIIIKRLISNRLFNRSSS